MMERLAIGEVSRRSGISIRMLRHYDEIGLVTPERNPENGYRFYTAADISRIEAIVALRQLGFGLGQIGALLSTTSAPLASALELRLNALNAEIAQRRRLQTSLRWLLRRLANAEAPSIDDLFDVLEELNAMERINGYYTPEQLDELAARADALGDDGMRKAEAEWAELSIEVHALIAEGVAPNDARARAAAERWDNLIRAFTGGNPGIEAGLSQVWANESEIEGVDVAAWRALGEYIDSVRLARD